jgi:hypothetical protein
MTDEGEAQAGSEQQKAEAVPHVHEFALGTIQLGVQQRYEDSSVD